MNMQESIQFRMQLNNYLLLLFDNAKYINIVLMVQNFTFHELISCSRQDPPT